LTRREFLIPPLESFPFLTLRGLLFSRRRHRNLICSGYSLLFDFYFHPGDRNRQGAKVAKNFYMKN
jgi:hypothetical protein